MHLAAQGPDHQFAASEIHNLGTHTAQATSLLLTFYASSTSLASKTPCNAGRRPT